MGIRLIFGFLLIIICIYFIYIAIDCFIHQIIIPYLKKKCKKDEDENIGFFKIQK